MTSADHDSIYRLAVEARRSRQSVEDVIAAAPPTLSALIELGVPALEIVRELEELLDLSSESSDAA